MTARSPAIGNGAESLIAPLLGQVVCVAVAFAVALVSFRCQEI